MKEKWTGERLETGIYNEATIEHLHRYAIALDFAKSKHVLDIASGEGYGAKLLASVATNVIAVDIDAETIQKAQKKYKFPTLRFETGSIESMALPDHSVDLVTCFETLEHTIQHEKALSEIKRVLKTNGILLISTPDKKEYSDERKYANPFHKRELYFEEFKKLLEENFSFVKIYLQRMVSGSLIIGDQGAREFTGDFTSIDKKEFRGYYFFAIASSSQLPQIDTSIFSSKSTLDAALKEQEKNIMNTLTYKVGHSMLFPFKIIRNIIR